MQTKYSSIFIANMAEAAMPLAHLMIGKNRAYEIHEDHALCDRFIFSDRDDRILITPFPLEKEFMNDSLQVLAVKNVLNFSPRKIDESICEAIEKDQSLFQRIVEVIKKNPGLIIHSDVATPEFVNLVKKLRKMGLKFRTPELPLEGYEWTTSYFDSKAGFRDIVPYLGEGFPAMPKGVACDSFVETIGWARHFLKTSDGFVLKSNRGWSGAGLRIVSKNDLQGKDLESELRHIFRAEPFWTKDTYVIEEFLKPDISICGGAPNIEARVTEKAVEPLYPCSMRITPHGVFKGIEIGQGAVPQLLSKKMSGWARQFGKLLHKFNYRGYYEIDFVAAKKGIFPIEANIRRTGGTHVYELGRKIFRPDFLKHHYLISNNIKPAPRFKGVPYQKVKEALKEFLYPINGKKEGVIITIISLLKRGDIGYAVVGDNKKRVLEIEEKFTEKLELIKFVDSEGFEPPTSSM